MLFSKRLLLIGLVVTSLWGGVSCRPPQPQNSNSGEFRVALNAFPTSLDPACITESNSFDVLTQIHRCLVRFEDGIAQAQPDLATFELKPIERAIRFELKPEQFSDGSKLNSDDVKRAWERALNPKTASPLASLYLGDIVGADELIAGKTQELSGFITLSETTFEISCRIQPVSVLNKLSFPVAAISKGARGEIGLGPYKIEQVSGSEAITLKRVKGAGVPTLKFITVSDAMTRLALFRAGRIDLAQVTMQDRPAIQKDVQLSQSLTGVSRLSTTFIQFQPSAFPPLKEIRVRKALALCLDIPRILKDQAYDSIDRPSTTLTHPSAEGYEPIRPWMQDIPTAKKLLAEAGYPDGKGFPKLTLAYATTQTGNPVVEAIVTQWRTHLGIPAEAAALSPGLLRENNQKHALPAFYTGWVGDYPHIENFVPTVFKSNSPSNSSEFKSAEVDRLIAEAEKSTDAAHSIDLYRRAERLALGEFPLIVIGYPKESWLWRQSSKPPKTHLGLDRLARFLSQ